MILSDDDDNIDGNGENGGRGSSNNNGSDDVALQQGLMWRINRIKPMGNMFLDWEAYFPVMHLLLRP